MRSIILFMSSSGCARMETLNLTIGDFVKATEDYHRSNDIYEVLRRLKNNQTVVPLFYLRRQKTNKYYYTCCSPEATTEIINYLLSEQRYLQPDSPLFKINDQEFLKRFRSINNQLGLGKVGHNIRFRSHMLRKLNQRKQDYVKILSEIKQGVYTETVNGKSVPKKNVLGEDILEPKHVQIGLNYNVICQDITDTESILRELRRIEHDILKILKKRVDE